jgi:hypothetical protein
MQPELQLFSIYELEHDDLILNPIIEGLPPANEFDISIADLETYARHLIRELIEGRLRIIPTSGEYSALNSWLKVNRHTGLKQKSTKKERVSYIARKGGKPQYVTTTIDWTKTKPASKMKRPQHMFNIILRRLFNNQSPDARVKFRYFSVARFQDDVIPRPHTVNGESLCDWIDLHPENDFPFPYQLKPSRCQCAVSKCTCQGSVKPNHIPLKQESMEDFVDRMITLVKRRNDIRYRMLTSGPDSVLHYWRHPDGEEAKGKKPQQKFNKLLRDRFRAQDLDPTSNDEQRFLYHAYRPRRIYDVVYKRQEIDGVEQHDWIDLWPEKFVPLFRRPKICRQSRSRPPLSQQQPPNLFLLREVSQLLLQHQQETLLEAQETLTEADKETAGADHAQIECGLHKSVVKPVKPGTVLVKHRAQWYYYTYFSPVNRREVAAVDGIIGVVSKKPFHPIDQPGPNEFMRCVSGTCPARVPPEQHGLIKKALESGEEVLLCVTKTTEEGCMEMYTGQSDGEVVGYVGSRTKYRPFTYVPYYQECDGCFHLNINANTANLLKKYHKRERKVWWEKKKTFLITKVFLLLRFLKICLVVAGIYCAIHIVMIPVSLEVRKI